MSGSRNDYRQGGASLLTMAREEDAVLRHALARARRERQSSPLLSASPEPAGLALPVQPEPEPHRLRDLIFRRIAEVNQGDAETPMEAEPLGGEVTMNTVSEPPVDGETASPAARKARSSASLQPAIGLTLAGAAIGAAMALAWPKTYVATSELLIDPQAVRASEAAGQLSADAAFALVNNQLRVLRSGTMLDAVADRLSLASDPEFNGDAAGPFGLGGILAGLGDLVGGDGASAVERRRAHTLQTLERAVETSRQGGSSVVAVSATTGDPEKSALIANTISELFLGNAGVATAASNSMGERLAELRAGVEDAERAIADFKAQNDLVDAQGRLISDDEILRLGERLSAAQARTVELNARAASTRDANVDSIVTGSLPEQYASSTLTELRARYADARQQVDRLGVKLGPRHPELLSAQAELEGARQEIAGELRRVAGALQTELTRSVREEQELASQLAQMKARQGDIGNELVTLRELEREAAARRSVYEQSLQAQGGSRFAVPGGSSLISRAVPPLQASGPSVPALSLVGALAGLLAGLGFAGLRGRRGEEVDSEAVADAGASERTATASLQPDMDISEHPASEFPEGRESAGDAEETDDMHPYPYHAYPGPRDGSQPAAAGSQQVTPGAAAGTHPVQQPGFAHPAYAQPVPPAPPGWPLMPPYTAYQPQPVAPMPGWPHAAHYPAPPHYYPPAGAYAAPPQQSYFGAPAYAPPPAQHAYPRDHEAPRSFEQPRQRAPEQAFDQDAYIDESTDAAIEEIRQSLREFRDAIEDFAHSRAPSRRYGT